MGVLIELKTERTTRFKAVEAARAKNKLLLLDNLSGLTTKVTAIFSEPLKKVHLKRI